MTALSDDVVPLLAAVSPERRETFEARVRRWWPDVEAGLAEVYDPVTRDGLAARLLRLAATAYAERDPDLHRLDLERTLAPDWFQEPSMLGYAAYAERFSPDGTLAGVTDQVPYLRELGVTYLHLMPLLQPRVGDSDGGYAVADYRTVRSDLGTVEDLRTLARELRSVGISLVLDLVLNHVAREHAWAVAARAGDERYRRYFRVFPDRTAPDAYERTLPEVFPDFAPGNFTWDDDLDAWVWTTFNAFQWDVDWSNPDVFAEYADIVFFLANLGVSVLRLDAIAFLWKRLGTNCQNQPEVHALTRALRALVRIACPAVVLKAEAIVAPDDLVQYLGRGRHHGKVSDLAYHNTLMVQIWSMLASRDVGLAVHALRELPVVPSSTAWITYLRCHDDIGWAVDDADAAAVGLSGYGHRRFLSDFYAGEFPGSFARGLVFQANPATGDRRISGMSTALAGLDLAVAEGDPVAVDLAVRRILIAHAIVMGWGGVPVLWMGDEIGQPGDPDWASEPGHEADNRWVHRPRMSPARQAARHDADTVAERLFTGLQGLARARAALPHLHASAASRVVDPANPGVLTVVRSHPVGDLIELFNVTDSWRPFPTRYLGLDVAGWHDVLADGPVHPGADGDVWLPPYAAMWLVRP
ncbi:alpha-amylase family protein [Jatrophihabitans sp. YIM 134969]